MEQEKGNFNMHTCSKLQDIGHVEFSPCYSQRNPKSWTNALAQQRRHWTIRTWSLRAVNVYTWETLLSLCGMEVAAQMQYFVFKLQLGSNICVFLPPS